MSTNSTTAGTFFLGLTSAFSCSRRGPGRGERVEEGGLADVGEPNDSQAQHVRTRLLLTQPCLHRVDQLGLECFELLDLLGIERREHVLGPIAHALGERPYADPQARVGLRLQRGLDALETVVTAR